MYAYVFIPIPDSRIKSNIPNEKGYEAYPTPNSCL